MCLRTLPACTARSAQASNGPCVSPCSPPRSFSVTMPYGWCTWDACGCFQHVHGPMPGKSSHTAR
eukprot:2294206-Lingulodinium_polyedra.AAC.1